MKPVKIIPPKLKTKRCYTCKEVKPLHYFYMVKEDYGSYQCKACQLNANKRPKTTKKIMDYEDYVKQQKERVGEDTWRKYYEST